MIARRRAGALAVALLLTGTLVAGCASLPTRGPVREGNAVDVSGAIAPFDFNPPGPRSGATREQIVSGFLSALQATPLSTKVATEFLTDDARAVWLPARRTVVYGTVRVVSGTTGVRVTLGDAYELDRNGRWKGPVTDSGSLDLELRFERQNGEWRLANPPDAMVIPQSHFEARYREYSLYFFDRTGTVLVPEPVYLPWGVQAPTLLVTGLLAGPSGAASDAEQTFIPAGTRLGVSVPVATGGLAEVQLTPSLGEPGRDQLDRLLAQLAWTLRQVDEIDRFVITVDGERVDVPGPDDTTDVNGFSSFTPAIATASSDFFGIRQREVIQVVGDSEIVAATIPTRGPGAVSEVGSLAVSMGGTRFALVDEETSRVAVLGRDGDGSAPSTVYDGVEVIRPSWDLSDRLWWVDRTGGGAVLRVLDGQRLRTLRAPGLSGKEARAVTVSRDGTRLAAVVGRPDGDRLLVLRVVRRADGSPLRLIRGVDVPVGVGWGVVRALAWRDPTTLAVLSSPRRAVSQVTLVGVDGAETIGVPSARADVLFERADDLAASPGGPLAMLLGTPSGRVYRLAATGRWELDAVATELFHPAFVG